MRLLLPLIGSAALQLGLGHGIRHHAPDGRDAPREPQRGELVIQHHDTDDDHHHALQGVAEGMCDGVDDA